jgi:hypothetical protein
MREILDKIGNDAAARLKSNILNVNYNGFAPANNTGQLINSIEVRTSATSVSLWAEDYIFQVSEGRRPGKYPPYDSNDARYGYVTRGKNKGKARGTFPNIADWVETKPTARSNFRFDSKTNAEKASTVFLISRKMKEKGTVIHQKGGSEMLSSVIDKAFTEAVSASILNMFSFQFNSILSGKLV